MEFALMRVIVAPNGGTVVRLLSIVMMILLLLLLAMLKGHRRLLPTLLMLASVPVATLVTASALTNLYVAATGVIVDLLKATALPQGFTTKIVANQEMERVVVSSSLVSLGIDTPYQNLN